MKQKCVYIPVKSGEFDVFFRSMSRYVSANASGSSAVWKHIPSDALSTLNDTYAKWYTAYSRTFSSDSKVDIEGRQIAYRAAARVIRVFVRQYLRFHPVTDDDRTAMGINNYDPVRTAHISVPELVELTTRLKSIRTILACFKVKGCDSKAKPTGYTGAVVAWDVLAEPPSRPEDLSRQRLASRTPYLIEFDESERGKTVYISVAWQNHRGMMGQWSEIQSAIVP